MKRDWIVSGRRPAGICAAALLIAAQAHFQDLDTTLRANLGEVVRQKGNDGQHCIVRQ